MLLCPLSEVEPGVVTGASILHPERPEMELLAPGQELSAAIIKRLISMGVEAVWTRHEAAADLKGVTGESLTVGQREVYVGLKKQFGTASKRTICVGTLTKYRQAIMDLVCDVVASREIAGLGLRLSATEGPLFAHSASVAYLSLLLGVELEPYIIQERSRLNPKDARDYAGLGLAGMLHDIGKTVGGSALADWNEASKRAAEGEGAPDAPEGYAEHPRVGYEMLSDCRAPSATRQAILMHHQRWDGSGWPGVKVVEKGRLEPTAGNGIHVFSRIVSAANVLDNLMVAAGGITAPPVVALAEFAGPRYDGWFDPIVRRAALRAVPPFTIGGKVTLSDGTDAVVTSPNRDVPLKPVVRPLAAGGEAQMIDLSMDEAGRTIVRAGSMDVSGLRYDVPTMSEAAMQKAA